ncbi:MAG: beta-lactamase family protein [Chitinophagales bacterium]|nr:beta-lactamase family protein [Chitinophagales bacterium]
MKPIILVILCLWIVSCTHSSKQNLAFVDQLFDWEKKTELSKNQINLAQSIDTFFKSKVKHTGFNGCVLVVQKGSVIYNNYFGYADYKLKKVFNDSSAFQLASVSKPFTATAIMILYEEGKLSIDDPVKKYIKGFPYDSITVKMLLNHRSGLQNYLYVFDTIKIPADSFITNQTVAEYFIKNKPALQATPGKHFAYCNTNYALLALVIEKVSGESYAQFIHNKIFVAAHMKHSFVSDAFDEESFQNHVADYQGSQWKQVPKALADGVLGDKGVYASCYDLYLFDQALNHEILLKQSTLDLIYKGYSYEKPGIKNYGLGWRLKEFENGEKLIYHNGWWRGYNTLFCRLPVENTCIIILSNKFNKSSYDVKAVFELLQMSDGVAED